MYLKNHSWTKNNMQWNYNNDCDSKNMLFKKVYFKNHLQDDSSFPEASNVYQEICILNLNWGIQQSGKSQENSRPGKYQKNVTFDKSLGIFY